MDKIIGRDSITSPNKTNLSHRTSSELLFWSRIGTPEYIINFLTSGIIPHIKY